MDHYCILSQNSDGIPTLKEGWTQDTDKDGTPDYLEKIITTGLMPPYGKKYIPFGGTSAAAPQVAGVIALMLSMNSTLRVKDIKNILYSSADPVYNQNSWTPQTGFGKVNAERAIQLVNSV
ncbi:MAG: S8 family serine peptidase [Chitinophagales bacterium]|nr:S8 family serine peptidase [Chitinophagales bacterium]